MAQLPVDVALARMLIEAQRLGSTRELLVLTAFLAIQDPRERPADARAEADAAHAAFADTGSDFISVLNLWQAHAHAHEELSQSKLRDWCAERFLSYLRMREWRELHRQLLVMHEPGDERQETGDARSKPPGPTRADAFSTGRPRRQAEPTSVESLGEEAEVPDLVSRPSSPGIYESIHRCLLSGWPSQVGRRDEHGEYRGTRERRFRVFPGSALAKKPPPWLLAAQILDLQKVYAMQCARIEPEWIEQQAAHLVKRNWRDPHWSRPRGAVMAFEQVTLFGLTLVEKRSVLFAAQDLLRRQAAGRDLHGGRVRRLVPPGARGAACGAALVAR
jgi:ATP-dependent helicase HrpA